MQYLTSLQGWGLLLLYLILTWVITYGYGKFVRTKEYFLVSERRIKSRYAAFSIAATWIWAPALFVSAEKGYTQGIAGLFWFTVPNILCLIIFGLFAEKMRKAKPKGFTMSHYIREKFSKRTHNLFLLESLGLQICSFAVQLLAGASIISKLTGIDFFLLTLALAIIPLTYTFAEGINASIKTDYWQMIWIAIVLIIGVPWAVSNAGGFPAIANGLGGISGKFGSLWDENGIMVFLTYGLPMTIGLMSGPFGDQMFWQRVFGIEKGIKKAFMWGALIFAVVPIGIGILGFIAAGNGIKVESTQLINLKSVLTYLPLWFIVPFIIMILAGLISTVDSVICAVSSIVGHDFLERGKEKPKYKYNQDFTYSDKYYVLVSRYAMLIVTVLAIIVANIPGLKIMYLQLFYGTLRASVFLPTIFAIKKVGMSEKGLFYGLLVSIFIGLPIFSYGNFNMFWQYIVAGSLTSVLASGIISVIYKRKERIFYN